MIALRLDAMLVQRDPSRTRSLKAESFMKILRFPILLLSSLIVSGCFDSDEGGDAPPDPYADLRKLPPDKGGTHLAHELEAGKSPYEYGFYLYLPGGMADTSAKAAVKYPMVVYLHGDGSNDNNPLTAVLNEGVPYTIANKKWHPPFPMIAVAPQNHKPVGTSWDPKKVHGFIQYLSQTYAVDSTRIYLTGMSQGGGGTFNYLATLKSDGLVAAAVPVAGWTSPGAAKTFTIPVWAFHGSDDKTLSAAKVVEAMAAFKTARPDLDSRVTLFPGLDHEFKEWYYTYVFGEHGPVDTAHQAFNEDIYSWMLRYRK
ncbi:MAG: dienelactone hydrolase family protein [Fibrobacteres bacterium]|nr:dienelactone hydrolase family protein [Fibrobacterota bacterium]